jgi:acyl-CoA thioester hydrolase
MVGETRIRVRYAETDKMGVVYHANYLLYFEEARTEFLEKLGFPYAKLEEAGYMSPVLDVRLSYGESLTYGDVAIVRTKVVKVTPVKTTYAYEVYKEGQTPGEDKPCVAGMSEHCLVRASDFRPVSQKKVAPELYEAYKSACEPTE